MHVPNEHALCAGEPDIRTDYYRSRDHSYESEGAEGGGRRGYHATAHDSKTDVPAAAGHEEPLKRGPGAAQEPSTAPSPEADPHIIHVKPQDDGTGGAIRPSPEQAKKIEKHYIPVEETGPAGGAGAGMGRALHTSRSLCRAVSEPDAARANAHQGGVEGAAANEEDTIATLTHLQDNAAEGAEPEALSKEATDRGAAFSTDPGARTPPTISLADALRKMVHAQQADPSTAGTGRRFHSLSLSAWHWQPRSWFGAEAADPTARGPSPGPRGPEDLRAAVQEGAAELAADSSAGLSSHIPPGRGAHSGSTPAPGASATAEETSTDREDVELSEKDGAKSWSEFVPFSPS